MTDATCVHSHVGLLRMQHEQENIPVPSMKGQCAMLRHIPSALAWSCTLANGAHTACHHKAANQKRGWAFVREIIRIPGLPSPPQGKAQGMKKLCRLYKSNFGPQAQLDLKQTKCLWRKTALLQNVSCCTRKNTTPQRSRQGQLDNSLNGVKRATRHQRDTWKSGTQ